MQEKLRTAKKVMDLTRLGSMHQSSISFSRSIIRKIKNEKWKIKVDKWKLCDDGYGTAVYKIKSKEARYSLVIFSQKINDSERNDRVIANKWDVTFALILGKANKNILKLLKNNVPLQEAGRTNDKVIVLSRANKSFRVFDNILNSLINNKKPDIKLLKEVGYLFRTTAVYGNGKFGIADFFKLNKNFKSSFAAQMCAVYVLRQFSLDLIHYLAKKKNKNAKNLDRDIQRFIGVGNATGLGMAPFLINHPKVFDNWIRQKESALALVSQKIISTKKYYQMTNLLKQASIHLKEVITIDARQRNLNIQASKDLKDMVLNLEKYHKKIWQEILSYNEKYSLEAEEAFISCLLELYPKIVLPYEDKMNIKEELGIHICIMCDDLIKILEEKYNWCININFLNKDNEYWFWYISEDKEEPRLGKRAEDKGSLQEMPLDIARQIKNLYDKLKLQKTNILLSEFLLANPSLEDISKRVLDINECVFGEIQANTIAKNFLPMHILRAKLSFFGATKFDPRSDRWVRVVLFQNAPLEDEDDYSWIFPTLKQNKKNLIDLTHNEIITTCFKAYYGLKISKNKPASAKIIANMVWYLEALGLNGIKHFARSFNYQDDNIAKITKLDKNIYKTDLNNTSIINHISLLVSFINDIFTKENLDYISLDIKNCHNRYLCLEQLARYKNLYISAIWENKQVIFKKSKFPRIYKNKNHKSQNLSIKISKNETAPIVSKDTSYKYSNNFKTNIKANKQYWQEIQQHAKKILVPSDTKSQKDAGE